MGQIAVGGGGGAARTQFDRSVRPCACDWAAQAALQLGPYLERLAELVGHDVVEHRVHSGGHVVQHAGGVGQRFVHSEQERAVGLVAACVHRQQALSVERRPADEEGHHDCNCKQSTGVEQ